MYRMMDDGYMRVPLERWKEWNQPRGYEHIDILIGVHIRPPESDLIEPCERSLVLFFKRLFGIDEWIFNNT